MNKKELQIEKFKELLILIINNCDNNDLYETKLWKLMYFCEADYYEKTGKTITNVDYYKNNFGPTPNKLTINKAIKRAKKYITVQKIKKDGENVRKLYSPLKKYDLKYISGNEIQSIQNVCNKYSKLSVNDIVLLAHKDTPHLGSKMKEKIDFSLVYYRDEDSLIEEEITDSKQKIPDKTIKKLLTYV